MNDAETIESQIEIFIKKYNDIKFNICVITNYEPRCKMENIIYYNITKVFRQVTRSIYDNRDNKDTKIKPLILINEIINMSDLTTISNKDILNDPKIMKNLYDDLIFLENIIDKFKLSHFKD